MRKIRLKESYSALFDAVSACTNINYDTYDGIRKKEPYCFLLYTKPFKGLHYCHCKPIQKIKSHRTLANERTNLKESYSAPFDSVAACNSISWHHRKLEGFCFELYTRPFNELQSYYCKPVQNIESWLARKLV